MITEQKPKVTAKEQSYDSSRVVRMYLLPSSSWQVISTSIIRDAIDITSMINHLTL